MGFGEASSKLLIGFTATAFRKDDKGLGEIFDHIVYEKNTSDLIDMDYLTKPRGVKIATDIDLSAVQTVDGDFREASLSEVMDTYEMRKLVIDTYKEYAMGLKSIAFGVRVQHAVNMASDFNNAGIPAGVIHSGLTTEDRVKVLEEYASGNIQVLCNCSVLTEGFDSPETMCVIVARPTKSKSLYQQMVGRGLRKFPNKKECVVIDFCDKDYTICNAAMLLKDFERGDYLPLPLPPASIADPDDIPAELDPELQKALRDFSPLGDDFVWKVNDRVYYLKGNGKALLQVIPSSKKLYGVLFTTHSERQVLIHEVPFDYAFDSADRWAKENRSVFTVSDYSAEWRKLPATEKQIGALKSLGFTKGTDKLKRGQAATLLDILMSKKNV